MLQAFGCMPLAFIENRGQLDERVEFSVRQGALQAYFTKQAFVVQLAAHGPLAESPDVSQTRAGANVFMTFEGASPDVVIEGCDPLLSRFNYFVGNDPAQWRTNLPSYRSIRYCGLYPGVDMVVRDHEGRLEYDLILAPGADLRDIVVRCEGVESLRVADHGALILETAAGAIEQPKPCTFEIGPSGDLQEVECTYRLRGDDRFGFDAPGHECAMPLVIDPGLVYGTFLGGSGLDDAFAIAVDDSGAAVIAGSTWSSDFPTTPEAYDRSYGGGACCSDGFVAKLSADGSSLVFGTFLGGSTAKTDICGAIDVDASGAIVVAGSTESADFPTTPGAYDTSFNGGIDAFVAKLSADGSSLIYATFLGGSGTDGSGDVALDDSGVAVFGGTGSADFPTTPGAYDGSYNGRLDGFVARLSADGTSLVYGTFLGGSEMDECWDMALDTSGAALLTGDTYSSDFPSTSGAYDTSYNGFGDVFVAKLSGDGTRLLYGTFLGGRDGDHGRGIAVDASGAAVVAGATGSVDFPTTPGAYDNSNDGDAFVVKLSEDGSQLIYGTFLGGSSAEEIEAIASDASGVTVMGVTNSTDFPTTPDGYDTSFDAEFDLFVARMSADGSALLYGTFLGGSGLDSGRALALDAAGAALLTGCTDSPDFPTSSGAYDRSINAGSVDAFVAKLDFLALHCEAEAVWSNYGPGWPGRHGVPSLFLNRDPALCLVLSLTIGNSLGMKTSGFLFIGVSPQDAATPWGGRLLVEPQWVFSLALPRVGLTIESGLPCDASFCGLRLYLQVLELDSSASHGVSFTPGLELVLGS
ncbi:MAG: hypothetical protein AB1486_14270 [Planctomycetota bacterium]